MAKGPRTVPTLPDGIAAHWGLPPIADPRRLAGGYHNVVLRSGDVVVRVEVREAASVAWEHELLAWLAAEVPEVVAPLPAADGSTFLATRDRVVSVFPFVEGEPSTGLAAADLLARIHVRGAGWPQTRERPGRPSYAGLEWECNDLHGDSARQNILWRGERIVGVVDWKWARLDWPAIELAAAAWTFAEDDVESFVSAYVAAGGPGEPEVLEEGRRLQLLVNALYSLTRGGAGSAWADYLLAELRELR